jgi:WD40 repeat protein
LFKGLSKKILSAIFSPDGKMVLTINEDYSALLYSATNGKLLYRLKHRQKSPSGKEQEGIRTAVFSPDGKRILTINSDVTAGIFSSQSGKELHVIQRLCKDPRSVFFSPDGKFAAITGRARVTIGGLYAVSTGELIRWLNGSSDWQRPGTTFSPDNKVLFVPTSSGSYLYFLSKESNDFYFSEEAKKNMDFEQKEDICLVSGSQYVFSPDGKYLVFTEPYDGRHIRIIELPGGGIKVGNIPAISSAKFSPDGKRILTVDYSDFQNTRIGNTARLLDPAMGKEIHAFTGHNESIINALFSPDGRYVLTTSLDRQSILWDAETGHRLYTRIQLKGNDYLIHDEHLRFEGTAAAMEKLSFQCGSGQIKLKDCKESLYVPGLAQMMLSGQEINCSKISDLNFCGTGEK